MKTQEKLEVMVKLSNLTTGILMSEYVRDISENLEMPSITFTSDTGEYEDAECMEILYHVGGFSIFFKVFDNELDTIYMETWARNCDYETRAVFDLNEIGVEQIVNIIGCETYMFFVD